MVGPGVSFTMPTLRIRASFVVATLTLPQLKSAINALLLYVGRLTLVVAMLYKINFNDYPISVIHSIFD